jgi:hypothetical protein
MLCQRGTFLALLMLLGTAQLLAFARVLDEQTTRKAASRAFVASVAALTRYHSLFLTLPQALAYLGFVAAQPSRHCRLFSCLHRCSHGWPSALRR